MVERCKIAVIDEDVDSRRVIGLYLEKHGHDVAVLAAADVKIPDEYHCILVGPLDGGGDLVVVAEYTKPVRMGVIVDAVERVLTRQAGAVVEVISIGEWALDPVYNVLSHGDGSLGDVRLTDKEKDILVLLYSHSNQSVCREDLLRNVWGYVDGVETHTLETHIYRLRQKIEVDPAAPQVLLTTEQGYMLKVGV